MEIMITFYHTLYERNVTEFSDKVEFTTRANGTPCIRFAASGRRYEIECEYVKKIEAVA